MLQRNPDDPDTHNKLATAFYRKGENERTIEHWGEALRLKPEWAEVKNNLAWVLATVEDEKLRNPTRAIELAEGACELTGYERPEMLDTLGVAYAAAGRFDEAVKIAEKAGELAVASGREELVADIEKHLELYKANKPYSD
jgi:Tfp pilus assembly protein PilF